MLMRYDPFREVDRFTDQLFGNNAESRSPWMPMDAVRKGDAVELFFDVPGVGRIAILEDPTGAGLGWITPAAQ